MRRLLAILSILLLTSCYDSAGTPEPHDATPPTTTTLGELRRLYAGQTFLVTKEVVVTGYVTSSDRAGNFYRSLIFEHDGTAAELMAGIDALHNAYPTGYRITVNLKGLAVGENHGILQIGRMPAPGSGYATDYIGSRAALDRHLFRSTEQIIPQPLPCLIEALTPDMAGRLVRIDGVYYAPETPDTTQAPTWSGTRRFADDQAHAIYVYTRPYADFANTQIPSCELLLTGILQCDASINGPRYTLRLRDETDVWH